MNKTCIITGATAGIGEATTLELLKGNQFQNFALLGRNEEKLNSYCVQFPNKNILTIPYDLSNLDDIENIIHSIYDKYNSIDCVLNIAGYTEPSSLLDTTLDNIEKTYRVNVFAPFLIIKECVKYMKLKQYGKILNVASTAGITPRPGWLSYATSKAAVIAMSQTLSHELAEYKIKVYTISPGRCATELRRKLAPNEDQSKIMQPFEVAKIICNLISDDENCLDGQNIIIKKA